MMKGSCCYMVKFMENSWAARATVIACEQSRFYQGPIAGGGCSRASWI